MASLPLGVSVVVPVFNSGPLLPELVRRVEASLFQGGRAGEILLVNDGSRDDSWSRIQRLAGGRVVGLDLAKNYGQHAALAAGVAAARFPVTVTLDDDLDQPPEAAEALLKKIDEGFDLVFGVPGPRRRHPVRNVLSKAAHRVLSRKSLAGARSAPLRAFRTDLRDSFPRCSPQFVTLDVLLHWSARHVTCVEVAYEGSRLPRSRQRTSDLLALFVNGLAGIGLWPFRAIGAVGLAALVAGSFSGLYWVWKLTRGEDPPGAGWFLSGALGLLGLQGLGFGVLGEIVGRSHLFNLRLPPPTVRRRAGEGA